MSESDGTKIGVSFEIPSLYFDSFLIAFVVLLLSFQESYSRLNVMLPKIIFILQNPLN